MIEELKKSSIGFRDMGKEVLDSGFKMNKLRKLLMHRKNKAIEQMSKGIQ